MSTRTQQVLDRLAELGFETRRGSISPFGDDLPLVSGVAWDVGTAQLALVAEMDDAADDESWRQLLFAGSGLRHHLVADGPAAFGTPVVLAIVGDEGEQRMRLLTEDLIQRYALFQRVDLNLVRHGDLERNDLDMALAPLLPQCRTLLGQEISRGEIQRFWTVLRHEVTKAASELDDIYRPFRDAAGSACADSLIGDSAEEDELPAPTPVTDVRLHRFRSFEEASLHFSQVSVVYGTNGSGKSSILEALELLWAHTSHRMPPDVSADEYERHLPRDGNGAFRVETDDLAVSSIAESPHAELSRCVLNHETAIRLVSWSPKERYAALLTTTGLEIPDLRRRTGELVESAKQAADAALSAAGLSTLPRSNSNGTDHLDTALSAKFSTRLPNVHDLTGIEQALAASTSSGASYQPREWPSEQPAIEALVAAETLIGRILTDERPCDDEISDAFDAARRELRVLAGPRREASTAVRRLLDAIVRWQTSRSTSPNAEAPDPPAAVPSSLAVRWLAHANGVNDAAAQFRADADALSDVTWARELTAYADALISAASTVPRDRLEPLTRPQRGASPPPQVPAEIGSSLYADAGFVRPAEQPELLAAALRQLDAELRRHVDALAVLDAELAGHPARSFGEHAESVLGALCRFELARVLRREGPISRASEELVAELLQGRLAPVVRELIAAIVRFEWYFKPLQLPPAGQKIVFGGLSTPKPDLDARLVLNAAERSVVGLAWFLALHLLQPEERRQVLVLDDPTSTFDPLNQAGFVSTLRAFVRLTRPGQVIVASHDEGVASLLAEQLAPVNDWPAAVTRIRCYRDAHDCSVAEIVTSDARRTVNDEVERLGITAQSASE